MLNTNLASQIQNIQDLNILLVKKINDIACFQYLLDATKIIQEYGSQIYLESKVIEEFKEANIEITSGINVFDQNLHEKIIDIIITIGGDGTILWALQYFQNRIAPPLISFDKGTLGYMCNFPVTKIDEIIKKTYRSLSQNESLFVETRFRIACKIIDKDQKTRNFVALNEFVLDRGPSPLACKIDCFIEDKFLTTYEGDGVIISTPNGSTAYQLTAGGPIVHQLVPSIALTPICPHSFNIRPIVLPMDFNLNLRISAESRNNAWFSFDGINRIEIKKGDTITVTKTSFHVPFVSDGSKQGLDTWVYRLRSLLGWNTKKFIENKELNPKIQSYGYK